MFRLFSKIRNCQTSLVNWSQTLGNSKSKIEEKQKELETLTAINDAANINHIQKVKDAINTLLFQDELLWRQRSRSIWMLVGDKNTKYFHQRAS